MTTEVADIDIISSDKVEGTTVYSTAGDKLGSIDDILIDKRSGVVRFAVLEFGGFLGVGTDRFPLPWNVLRYDPKLGGYIVPVEKARLDNAPKYESDDPPRFDPEYGTRVDTFYGIY